MVGVDLLVRVRDQVRWHRTRPVCTGDDCTDPTATEVQIRTGRPGGRGMRGLRRMRVRVRVRMRSWLRPWRARSRSGIPQAARRMHRVVVGMDGVMGV